MDLFMKYLLHVKTIVQNLHADDSLSYLYIVMGNESCDLDSMISALALAYLRYQKHSLVIPIMNINSHEFAIRTENVYVLKKLSIDSKLLIFRDTLDLNQFHSKGILKLVLVDHHVLNENDGHLATSVDEIFDHRPLDPSARFRSDVNITIQDVASCATLIADQLLHHTKTDIITHTLANLLYSVITFDTVGFSVEAGKTRPLDTEVANTLNDKFDLCKDTKTLFEELWNAHNDVSHLTPEQLLYKDMKVVHGVPIPGLPMLVDEFLKLPNAVSAMHDLCKFKGCNIMIIIGLHVNEGRVYRDLAIFCCSGGEAMQSMLAKTFKGETELCLTEKCVEIPHVVYFMQENVKLSRKYILPIVKEVLLSSSS